MSERSSSKSSMRGKKTVSSFWLLLISLAIALVLWYICTTQDETNIPRSCEGIQVVYTNSAVLNDYSLSVIESDNNITVDAVLKGKASAIRDIDESNLLAVVDLSLLKAEGRQTAKPVIEGLPEGVSAVRIDNVEVNIEKTVTKPLNITLEIVGTPAKGYIVDRKNIAYTKTVNISCGESISKNVAGAKIVIDVTGRSQSYDASLNVILLDILGNEISTKGIRFDHESVNVSVNVTADVIIISD